MAIESLQPNLFVAVTVTLSASTVALGLRFVARRMTKVSLWWDDFMCVGAYIFGAGWCALLILWAYDGFGLHLKDIELTPKESLTKSLFFCYLAELFYAFSIACSKFAVLGFYWRMFRTSNIKVPILTLVAATWTWLILRTFLAIFHCVPVEAFWDKAIPNATCHIDDSKFFFGTVLAHLLLDLAILSLPILQVRKLKLRKAQKVGVVALFMFGTLTCIASIIVLIYSISYDTTSPEISWNVAPIMIWATVEVDLAIIAACLPMLRPIFMEVYHRVFPNASLGSSHKQDGTNKPRPFIKMSTLRSKSRLANDSDSTHQLADSIDDYGSSNGDEAHHVHGVGRACVVITGGEVPSEELERVTLADGRIGGGILVRSETHVQVTRTW